MPINQSVYIKKSVGYGGVNQFQDAKVVQAQLNAQLPAVHTRLAVDGRCGPVTIATIRSFQKLVVGLRNPDGRVDPNGKTLIAMNSPGSEAKWRQILAVDRAKWGGDSARWSQEKKLASMNPGFRVKVMAVLGALSKRGFEPKVFYGWRSVEVQLELVKKGRSKVKFSFHNAQKPNGIPNSYAADIIDRRWAWTAAAEQNGFWDALGAEAKERGLVWGGDWTSFKDVAHIQGRRNSELVTVKRESGL
ncbi:M15 family metallopeptidase [Thiocapsa bogorovii]|uniref:M15 family metallopeptidase n=1 Tax=Thiocapsa bogorovii TaxID=521689 RepID=UPI001E40ED08|nr:M15 family metallopeptidase [Thiocapsa bogorovii]UHD16113.1 M15 family metallopeptidase [Thiocapsa bogorovii]